MKRLQDVSSALMEGADLHIESPAASPQVVDGDDVSDYQIRRMERQVGVLERTTAQLIQR
jgi:hypothetical protein